MPSFENGVDLAAVARVARNINLRDIRMIRIDATCSPSPSEALEPQISFETSSALVSEHLLNVICVYDFSVSSGGQQAASATIAYLMMYEVVGESVNEDDIEHFARANGVYHSWPFLRQLLFDLTSKMGFSPLTLPVFQVLPRSTKQQDKIEAPAGDLKPKKRKVTPKERGAK